MSPNSEEIRLLFDQVAPVYDQLNDWLSLGQHRIWKKMTVKWSSPSLGATCLDLCCGSGDLAQILAQQVGPTGQIYGVDFSTEQLVVAKHRSENISRFQKQARVTWIEADALALPFADQTFDVVTMGYGLRNVTRIPDCLREIYRVLKPGCKAAILDFHQPLNPWLQAFQQWYLRNVVVSVAAQFGLTEEYAYLEPSLEQFPRGSEQVRLSRQVGFTQAIHYSVCNGMMGVLVLTR